MAGLRRGAAQEVVAVFSVRSRTTSRMRSACASGRAPQALSARSRTAVVTARTSSTTRSGSRPVARANFTQWPIVTSPCHSSAWIRGHRRQRERLDLERSEDTPHRADTDARSPAFEVGHHVHCDAGAGREFDP